MAKTNQAAIRRKLAQAVHNCERAMGDLAEVAEMYESGHADMAELLQILCVSLDLTIAGVGTFAMKAWGRVPEDWEQWRNPRQPKSKVKHAASNG